MRESLLKIIKLTPTGIKTIIITFNAVKSFARLGNGKGKNQMPSGSYSSIYIHRIIHSDRLFRKPRPRSRHFRPNLTLRERGVHILISLFSIFTRKHTCIWLIIGRYKKSDMFSGYALFLYIFPSLSLSLSLSLSHTLFFSLTHPSFSFFFFFCFFYFGFETAYARRQY
jgi:hypothetical protein